MAQKTQNFCELPSFQAFPRLQGAKGQLVPPDVLCSAYLGQHQLAHIGLNCWQPATVFWSKKTPTFSTKSEGKNHDTSVHDFSKTVRKKYEQISPEPEAGPVLAFRRTFLQHFGGNLLRSLGDITKTGTQNLRLGEQNRFPKMDLSESWRLYLDADKEILLGPRPKTSLFCRCSVWCPRRHLPTIIFGCALTTLNRRRDILEL